MSGRTDVAALSSAALREMAERRGLGRACDLFPDDVAFAAARAARPWSVPERTAVTEPALQFDPARRKTAP